MLNVTYIGELSSQYIEGFGLGAGSFATVAVGGLIIAFFKRYKLEIKVSKRRAALSVTEAIGQVADVAQKVANASTESDSGGETPMNTAEVKLDCQ